MVWSIVLLLDCIGILSVNIYKNFCLNNKHIDSKYYNLIRLTVRKKVVTYKLKEVHLYKCKYIFYM
jgi:hypothetical protein